MTHKLATTPQGLTTVVKTGSRDTSQSSSSSPSATVAQRTLSESSRKTLHLKRNVVTQSGGSSPNTPSPPEESKTQPRTPNPFHRTASLPGYAIQTAASRARQTPQKPSPTPVNPISITPTSVKTSPRGPSMLMGRHAETPPYQRRSSHSETPKSAKQLNHPPTTNDIHAIVIQGGNGRRNRELPSSPIAPCDSPTQSDPSSKPHSDSNLPSEAISPRFPSSLPSQSLSPTPASPTPPTPSFADVKQRFHHHRNSLEIPADLQQRHSTIPFGNEVEKMMRAALKGTDYEVPEYVLRSGLPPSQPVLPSSIRIEQPPRSRLTDTLNANVLNIFFPSNSVHEKKVMKIDDDTEIEIFPILASPDQIRDFAFTPEELNVVTRLSFFRADPSDEQIAALVSRFKPTEVLFSHCPSITDASLQSISSLPNLKSVLVRFCPKVTMNGIASLPLERIEDLSISTERPFRQDITQRLAGNSSLQTIDFSLCSALTPDVLLCLKEAHELHEIALNVKGCDLILPQDIEKLNTERKEKPFVVNLGPVEESDLKPSPKIPESPNILSMTSITTHFPHRDPKALPSPDTIRMIDPAVKTFTGVNLRGDGISNDSLVAFINKFPMMEMVRLCESKVLSYLGIVHLRQLLNIQKIHLEKLTGITSKMLEIMLSHNLESQPFVVEVPENERTADELNEVTFTHVHITDSALDFLSRLKSLKSVTISNSDQFSGDAIRRLILNCPSLQQLSVIKCNSSNSQLITNSGNLRAHFELRMIEPKDPVQIPAEAPIVTGEMILKMSSKATKNIRITSKEASVGNEVKTWQKLTEAYFREVPVSDVALQTMSRLPSLQRLTLSRCDRFTVQGLKSLVLNSSSLTHLAIEDCPSVDLLIIEELKKIKPGLNIEVLHRPDPTLFDLIKWEVDQIMWSPKLKRKFAFLQEIFNTNSFIPETAKFDEIPATSDHASQITMSAGKEKFSIFGNMDTITNFYLNKLALIGIDGKLIVGNNLQERWMRLDQTLQAYQNLSRTAWAIRETLFETGFFLRSDSFQIPQTIGEIQQLLSITNQEGTNPFARKIKIFEFEDLGLTALPFFISNEKAWLQLKRIKLKGNPIDEIDESLKSKEYCPKLQAIEYDAWTDPLADAVLTPRQKQLPVLDEMLMSPTDDDDEKILVIPSSTETKLPEKPAGPFGKFFSGLFGRKTNR